MKKEAVVEILKQHGFILDREKSIPHGVQLIFRNVAMVSVYHTGKFNVQGKHFDVVSKHLAQPRPVEQARNAADDEF